MEPGIIFDHVWKKFRRGEVHGSLRDLIPAAARRLRQGPRPAAELQAREFWALSDVSFEVKPGEALGIIGANGAGKSTVLKMLNRIIRPNRGLVEVRGRAGALIEVSAGFHQDLTGKENVFLQGAIMGMRKAEIVAKFDQIVEFAGIGEFIDTPVKRYSSGMNARLGFSIAAHLDPEVLVIDEVLAVGDFAFQERAFGRIKELVARGIPVVLVSHQLDRIASLCTKAMLLKQGKVHIAGTPHACIAEYVRGAAVHNEEHADASVVVHGIGLVEERVVLPGERVTLHVVGEVRRPYPETCEPLALRVRVVEWGETVIYEVGSRELGLALPAHGPFAVDVDLDFHLGPGSYRVDVLSLDRVTRGELSSGASMYLTAAASDPPFGGAVHLNARMRVA